MEIRKKVEIEKTTGYLCDVCQSSCNKSADPRFEEHEYAILTANWGYHSKRDCIRSECHLCEECYEKVNDFIKSLGGTVRECDDYLLKEGRDYIVGA